MLQLTKTTAFAALPSRTRTLAGAGFIASPFGSFLGRLCILTCGLAVVATAGLLALHVS